MFQVNSSRASLFGSTSHTNYLGLGLILQNVAQPKFQLDFFESRARSAQAFLKSSHGSPELASQMDNFKGNIIEYILGDPYEERNLNEDPNPSQDKSTGRIY